MCGEAANLMTTPGCPYVWGPKLEYKRSSQPQIQRDKSYIWSIHTFGWGAPIQECKLSAGGRKEVHCNYFIMAWWIFLKNSFTSRYWGKVKMLINTILVLIILFPSWFISGKIGSLSQPLALLPPRQHLSAPHRRYELRVYVKILQKLSRSLPATAMRWVLVCPVAACSGNIHCERLRLKISMDFLFGSIVFPHTWGDLTWLVPSWRQLRICLGSQGGAPVKSTSQHTSCHALLR